MKTKLLLCSVVFCLLFSGCQTRCEKDSCKNETLENEQYCAEHVFEYEDNYNEMTITGYIGKNTDILIPEQIDGKEVTTIGESAFEGFRSLSSIDLPDTLIFIEDHAFFGCKELRAINIPSKVTSIGEYAFADCQNLKGIKFPKNIECIERNTFEGCTSLETVDVPENLTYIGDYAFKNCSSLKEAVFKTTDALVIGDAVFEGCQTLEKVDFKLPLPKISCTGDYTTGTFADFSYCDSLRVIDDGYDFDLQQELELEKRIYEVRDSYGVDILIYTIYNSMNIETGKYEELSDLAHNLYISGNYGCSSDKSGIALILNSNEGEFSINYYGSTQGMIYDTFYATIMLNEIADYCNMQQYYEAADSLISQVGSIYHIASRYE